MLNLNAEAVRELEAEWDNNPPKILFISEPYPGSPDLPLTGGGVTRMTPDKFEKELKDALESQGTCRIGSSHYRVNVWEEDPEDIANQYILKSWHRFDGAVPYEALFVLYYDAVDRIKSIEKHMPELLVDILPPTESGDS